MDDDEDEERVEVSSVEGEFDEDLGRDLRGDLIDGGSSSPLGEGDVLAESEDADGSERDEMPQEEEEEEEASPEKRATKRRKLSITSLPEFSSPLRGPEPVTTMEEDQDDEQGDEEQSRASFDSSPNGSPSNPEGHSRKQQPTFQQAPRFKTLDNEITGDALPAAFSPQRRGAKYLTGGLAAELQGWLSEVKGEDGTAGSTFQVTVQEVRAGRRMYLVRGRVHDEDRRRVILAGEGRVTGLGRRAVVGMGSVVEVGQPVWDAEVEGETWMVACDWTVS